VLLALAVGVTAHYLAGGGQAARLASLGERLANAARRALGRGPVSGWAQRGEHYRADSVALLRSRWRRLTLAVVTSHVALFLVLFAALRVVGGDVGVLEVLAVFAVTRLLTLVPVTPGSLGIAELSYVAGLTSVGVDSAAAAGGVLVFRALTWLLPTLLGGLVWLLMGSGAVRGATYSSEPRAAPSGR
jgi:putative heme transporter